MPTTKAMTGALTALLILSLAACSADFRNHGYVPRDADLAQIQLGQDTRATVVEKIGAPSTGSLRRQNTWYYVESRFRQFGPAAPQEIERQVVRITFSPAGRVSNVERFGLEDGRVVRLQARVTDTVQTDTGFLREIFGNLGNADASALLN